MKEYLSYPFDSSTILRKKKLIKRNILEQSDLIDKRVAILGGSTTSEIKNVMELFLLNEKIKPVFYESEYGKYYEDIMFDNSALINFRPNIIYIHTTNVNINFPQQLDCDKAQIEKEIEREYSKFRELWERISQVYKCVIIQNNFELPYYRIFGNLDCADIHGRVYFVSRLNAEFAKYSQVNRNFYINDINYLSAWLGLEAWYDKSQWYAFKYALSYKAIPLLAYSVANIVKAIYGKSKKCLVLDLDNVLWGGVVGDDGVENIKIGGETPEAEAYAEFQRYIKELKNRGVILAVCSKNDPVIAKEGLSHEDNVLKFEDFTVFKANWRRKDENLADIAKEINIGINSIVFVDDNPVERDIVSTSLNGVSTPDIGENVVNYINVIDKAGYFEPAILSLEDINRSVYYKNDIERKESEKHYSNYDDFLKALGMVAEISRFAPLYLDRITQLINKTNQFNLTTRRYTYSEVETISNNDRFITLYGKLKDKFGDNGIVSVIVGNVIDSYELHMDLWLMSCRVFKRGMEQAMFDALVSKSKKRGIKTIVGYFYKTNRNELVSQHYGQFGFKLVSKEINGDSLWRLDIPEKYICQNKNIKLKGLVDGKNADS